MFACLSNLKKSCIKFYMEQTLFRGQVMKMCGTVSNMAHKSDLGADSTLRKFPKSLADFQFRRLDFGLILLSIHCELDLDL